MARLLLLLGSHEGAKAAEAERGNELAGLATKGDPSPARWRRWRHYAQQVTVRGRARVRVGVRVRVRVRVRARLRARLRARVTKP